MKFNQFNPVFQRIGPKLALAAAVFMPLKLTLAYAILVPLLILWIISQSWQELRLPEMVVPLVLFILVALLSSLFGIAPFRSVPKFFNLTLFSLSILVFAQIGRQIGAEKIILASLCGQLIASLRSILSGATYGRLPRLFLGEVTQSGQLAVQLPVAIGLAFWLAHSVYMNRPGETARNRSSIARIIGLGFIVLCLSTALGLAPSFNLSATVETLLLVALAITVFVISRKSPHAEERVAAIAIGIIVPVLAAALLINLKRGPWLGVAVGTSVFFFFYARKLVAPMLVAVAGSIAMVEPLRTRVLQSTDHFFIQGGRNVMWRIGTELATRFPLGIGYHNSRFLRHFSVQIPPQHNHFHNNLLNILVETGWIGLAVFVWWMLRLLARSFRSRGWNRDDILACALGCAILSWQTAGIVEYNFGDSEVVNVVWVMVGCLVAIRQFPEAAETAAEDNDTENSRALAPTAGIAS